MTAQAQLDYVKQSAHASINQSVTKTRTAVMNSYNATAQHGGISSTSFNYDESTKKMLAAMVPKERPTMIDPINASIKGDAVKDKPI